MPETAAVFQGAAPEPENEVYSEANHLIRLESAINDTASFQLVLNIGLGTASIWGITVGDLKNGAQTIPAERVQIYREGWVRVDEYPSWYLRLTPNVKESREFADVLIPLSSPKGALPIDLQPGRHEVIWVEIRVPPGTEPGNYRSVMRVTPRNGQVRELNLSLTVWPFAVPQTRHLSVVTGLETKELLRQHLEVNGRPYAPAMLSFDDPAYARATQIIDGTMHLLHEHRCSPMLRDVHPIRRAGAAGQLELDWADYDRLVAGVIDGSAFEDRAAAPAWPFPVNDHDPPAENYGGWDSQAYEHVLVDYLTQCVAHFAQRGWLDRHFFWMAMPGEPRGVQYQRYHQLGQIVRGVDERIRLLCHLTPQPMTAYGWRNDPFIDLANFVNIWCPPASLSDPEELARQKASGKDVWLWPDQPPYAGSLSLIAPPNDARSLAWQAYRFGLSGVLIPAIAAWETDGAPRAAGSDSTILWPGKPYGLSEPIPSIRLKRLLRGIQDYEYLWLLEQNGRPAIAKIIASDLFAYGGTKCYGEHFLDSLPLGWATDGAAWSLARRLMARELISAMQSDAKTAAAGENISAFEQQIEWARLTRGVRQVRTSVEGLRVQINEKDLAAPIEVQATVSVFNARQEPFSGSITLAQAPEGWSNGEASQPIEHLEPLHQTRRLVRAKTAAIKANSDGVFPLALALGVGEEKISTTGRLCVLTSQRVARPPRIDGKLDEWPLGVENVAGDFVLVGALDVPRQNRPTPDRPAAGTNVFVCNDGQYLYLGFNCMDDAMKDRYLARSNNVNYDALWPTGEDMLEIVLDPTGRAMAPGDIYHIVVKGNGAVVAERGVPCLEQVADCRPWSAAVVAAVDDQTQPNRWTAEVRIPLSALGERAAVWGINFGRFHARRGEYSSWSGARRYLYSPVTLGNIRLE